MVPELTSTTVGDECDIRLILYYIPVLSVVLSVSKVCFFVFLNICIANKTTRKCLDGLLTLPSPVEAQD